MTTQTIVIVDDDRSSLSETSSALREAGFSNILTFLNPAKLLDEYDSITPVDLIITDMRMNPINGLQLLNELEQKETPPGCSLVISKAERPTNFEGNFLQKHPFVETNIVNLLNVVQELLSTR